ncbi:hypothetical protein Taro_001074 [Colocasia esculenta]|uniref:Uncharacterized protein n=1 Tax=Colocasia esculenta TaxID=4460 RepID=A0A843TGY9_COLES|nr:hypothetical protein [Colocasia esculenta]
MDYGPVWMRRDYWESLCHIWATGPWQERSQATKRNRAALPEKNVHTSGSVSYATHNQKLRHELEFAPTFRDLFDRTHKRKGTDDYRVAERNKQNRSTQSMTYRRDRTSHYQLMNDFSNMHGRNPHRLELFKMGRCKDLPDGSESWVDEESWRRYETMTQLIAPSSDVDAESHTPATLENAFISVVGKDRPGRVRCAGSGETLSTWYKSIGTFGSSE